MPIDERSWTRLAAKLISDTRDRKIKWKILATESAPPTLNAIASLIAPKVIKTYFASFDDKGFLLELAEEAISKPPQWRLSISAANGKPIKRLPIGTGLSDLALAVEDQIAQVDEFVSRYLNS